MTRSSSGSVEIVIVADDLRTQAITAAFGGSQLRAARAINRQIDPHEELILAVVNNRAQCTHAALLSRSPGRTAMLTVTPATCENDRRLGAMLVQRAINCGNQLQAALVQTLVEPLRADDLQMFSRGGMRSIGTLAYLELVHRAQPDCAVAEFPANITIHPWDPHDRHGLEMLLEATYVDSLDCPGLSTLRRTADILDGHLHTGVVDPENWLILRMNGVPAGVSMMSEIPTSNCVELVYFGIAPQARGRGLAGLLLDRALNGIARCSGRTVALACDESNHPAMKLYKSRGFSARLRRAALVAAVPM